MFSAQHKFGRLGAPAGRSLEAQIAALFSDGVIYDPSDISTLFTDAAGTTPVTALEQPVGLMLDKSRGLVLGSELVAPLDFTSGWTSSGAAVTFDSASTFTASGVANVFRAYLTVGRWYKLNFRATFTGGIALYNSNTATNPINSGSIVSGTEYTFYFYSAATQINIRAAGAATVTVNTVSVRELPGYHAYHTPGDTTTRPVVSRRINLLTKTEDFADAAWVASRLNKTATKLTPNTENNYHYCAHSVTYTASGFVATIEAKADGYQFLQLLIISSGNYVEGVFNLSGAGTVENTSRNSTWTGTRSIELLSDGYYRCTVTVTTASAASGLFQTGVFPTNDSTATFAGDGTKGILVRKASLVPADLAALPYQRVNTTTDYDSDASKYPTFLRTDGVNDSLQTNAIDFSATDKMFVGAAVRKLSDAASGVLAEFSADSAANNGTFLVTAPSSSGANSYRYSSRGTAFINAGTGVFAAAPTTSVVVGVSSISGDSVILRVNGSQIEQSTGDQGTGNYGNHKLYLFMRAGTSVPFLGWFYGSLIKGATLSASQIALADRWLASKTKTVTLA